MNKRLRLCKNVYKIEKKTKITDNLTIHKIRLEKLHMENMLISLVTHEKETKCFQCFFALSNTIEFLR